MSESLGSNEDAAYLLSWDGSGWRDMVRLAPVGVTTVGRAPTNKVVLKDEVCSRNHCEIFKSNEQWKLRDLGSRNGTLVDGEPVAGDLDLQNGQVIEIGSCLMAFTDDMSAELPPSPAVEVDSETQTSAAGLPVASILHRRNQFEVADPERTSTELAKLYRLGLQLAAAKTRGDLANVVLTSLAEETVAEIAAILLVAEGNEKDPKPSDLQPMAYHADNEDQVYHRMSDSLSSVVLGEREAILARDVSADSQLAVFDSLGQMQAMSVICVPIQREDRLLGLVHLYATNPDNPLDVHELDFSLAVADQMAIAMEQLQDKEKLQTGLARREAQNKNLLEHLELATEIIGNSSVIQKLRKTIGLLAPTDATVLIRGDSGVGKELVARSIHLHSNRKDGPMVCLNCAALNESLLESELFGHEKGAFTGATDRKQGRFEQADRGTLFLDEIGEMTPSIQAKFLRVLEGHPFERVGGSKPITVDVRVVAATNRNLEEAVEDNEFRSDLYFRLNVAEIFVSPLSERRDDIPLLAQFFLQKFTEKTGRPISGFTDAAMAVLTSYGWPGNVRELQNTIERTVILCGGELVCVTDIQLSRLNDRRSDKPAPGPDQKWEPVALANLERDHILAMLDFTEWNKSKASQMLGIERSTLDRKLKRYQVSRPTK